MEKKNNIDYLGFDDTLFMIIFIPLLAVFIPIAFFRENFIYNQDISFWKETFEAFLYTSMYWFGIRTFVKWIRRKYHGFQFTRIRAVIQFLFVLFYCFFATILVKPIISSIPGLIGKTNTLEGFIAAYFCSFFVLAIYEGLYLYDQNKSSILEKEKMKREQIHSELQGLRNQVNPHFLFNSMNTLMNIIDEDKELANSFLKKLSDVYRYILEKRDDHLISLKDEIQFINSYIFLQKERFKNNLDVEIHIHDKYMDKKIVPLSLQILFENAIKHNIISSKKPLFIEVFIDQNNKLVVQNNLQLKKQAMPSTGVGLQNITSRFEYFSDLKVEVDKLGDKFTVRLPLLDHENVTYQV